jgi:hypothetical protein
MYNPKKIYMDRWTIPVRLLAKLRETAAMRRHRNYAVFGADARVLADGWIDNPAGPASRIVIGSNTLIRGLLFAFPHGGSIRLGEWCYVGTRVRTHKSVGMSSRL